MKFDSFMPLDSAYLCVDCDVVGDNSKACACCGSQALLSLGRILGRRPAPEVIEDDVIKQMERESKWEAL